MARFASVHHHMWRTQDAWTKKFSDMLQLEMNTGQIRVKYNTGWPGGINKNKFHQHDLLVTIPVTEDIIIQFWLNKLESGTLWFWKHKRLLSNAKYALFETLVLK